MNFIPLKYKSNTRPESDVLLPVTGRIVRAKDGEIIPVPEQDVAALLASGNWAKQSASKNKKKAAPAPETRPENDLTTR